MDNTPDPKEESKLTVQQQAFLSYYLDPRSESFGNAYKSALRANYSEEYSQNMIGQLPEWLSGAISHKKQLLKKAELRLDKSIDSADERIALDASKFVAARIGKDEGWADRQEHTGEGGAPITIQIAKEISDKNGL